MTPLPAFRPRLASAAVALLLLTGCDLLGIEPASAVAARKEAEAKAIGGACRHAGRAIEDCYQLNKRADRAAIFAGWRDMNDYMRENKLEEIVPQINPVPAQVAAGPASKEEADDDAAPAAVGKGAGKKP